MDEKDFKKHLADLVHGHHHPEQHDWSPETKPHKKRGPAGTKSGKSSKRTLSKVRGRAK